MGCLNSCWYTCEYFYNSYIRDNRAVQIVLTIIGGMLLMVILLAIFGAFRSHCDASNCDPDKSCYYSALVKQWPQTACRLEKTKPDAKPEKKCVDKLPKFLTIHGLWPQLVNKNSILATCADNTNKFDMKDLESVKAELVKRWPSILANNDNNNNNDEQFWSHEWSKHGTCGPKWKPIDYFKRTLDADSGYDVSKWLEDEKIKPSNSEPVELTKFSAAIEKHISKEQYRLSCAEIEFKVDGQETKKQIWFHEIVICLEYDSFTDRRACSEMLPLPGKPCPDKFYYVEDEAKMKP